MRLTIAIVVTAAALCAATPAAGQSFLTMNAGVEQLRQPQTPPRTPANQPKKLSKPKPKVATIAFGNFDFQKMLATNSFKAVLGQSFMLGFGGGVDIANLGAPIFLRISASMAMKTGERTIVTPDGAVITTGIPLKVSMLPIEIGGGWRSWAPGKKTPYAGIALLLMKYKETSDEVDDDENTSTSFRGFELFGGVDISMSRAVSFGLEGQYRSFPNKIGEAGASAVFGETDLGGLVGRVRLAFKF